MSMKERPRERKEVNEKIEEETKEETDESVNEWLDNIEIEPEKSEKEITEEKTIPDIIENSKTQENEITKVEIEKFTEVQEEPEMDLFIVKLPVWVNKPWMYVQPTHPNQLGSWINSWTTVILDYSRSYRIHIINLTQLMKIYPFSNSKVSKDLTLSQLDKIVDTMVNEGLAKWLDENRVSARIYYLTNQQWAEKIMKFLISSGYAAEIMTFFELQKLDQEWSTLPKSELEEIFELLVFDGRAKWVGDGKDTVSFVL